MKSMSKYLCLAWIKKISSKLYIVLKKYRIVSFLLYTFCFIGFIFCHLAQSTVKLQQFFVFPWQWLPGLGIQSFFIPASFAWAYLCKDAGLPPEVTTFLFVKDLLFIIYLHICCGCKTELAMVAGTQKWVRNPVSFCITIPVTVT